MKNLSYSVTFRGTKGHYDIYPDANSGFNFSHRIFCTRGKEGAYFVRDERMHIDEEGRRAFNTRESKKFITIGKCMEYIASELMG